MTKGGKLGFRCCSFHLLEGNTIMSDLTTPKPCYYQTTLDRGLKQHQNPTTIKPTTNRDLTTPVPSDYQKHCQLI